MKTPAWSRNRRAAGISPLRQQSHSLSGSWLIEHPPDVVVSYPRPRRRFVLTIVLAVRILEA